jgi:hypothetical protein
MRHLAILIAAGLLAGCAAYGGVSTARIGDDRVVTSSRSATIGTEGVTTRESRSEIRY